MTNILIVTAVEAERQAVLTGLSDFRHIDVELCGFGPMESAARTSKLLAEKSYDLVINMGVAGAFQGRARIGDCVVASESISADLGAESGEGFKTVEDLGFGKMRFEVATHAESLKEAIEAAVPAHIGPILTLSTATGTEETEVLLAKRFDPAAEAMEGAGVATAASLFDVDFLEIRTISNMVGPRDKGAWRLDHALQSLKKVAEVMKGELSS
ncbi:futalosine hydrolase [Paenalkalicoccus suaedae]|nr:futalosine hydrolase [Paenalkalicoccus suaedae]